MLLFTRLRGVLALAILATSLAVVTTDFAEARRGGSFGSRGGRTFQSPAATPTAPRAPDAMQRTMTPRDAGPAATAPGARTPAGAATQQPTRGGMFGGMAGGLLGGLMLGGLIGMMMGNGLGGLAGILGLLVQVALVAVAVMFIMRLVRGRGSQQPAYAGAGAPSAPGSRDDRDQPDMSRSAYTAAVPGSAPSASAAAAPSAAGSDEIGLTGADFDAFEQLLNEVQAAFSREDFARLRALATPEIVSFLSEELSENAVKGVRNDVTDVRLLQGDLAESWREGTSEFATVAMRYDSVDVTRDRQSGEIVDGSTTPSETTEVWTFVRPSGGAWKLSAIQQA